MSRVEERMSYAHDTVTGPYLYAQLVRRVEGTQSELGLTFRCLLVDCRCISAPTGSLNTD